MPLFGNFGVDLAQQLATGMGPSLLAATLIKVTPGTRTPSNISGGTNPTTVSYSCRGFVDEYKTGEIDGELVHVRDRKVVLLGKTISNGAVVPTPGDRVTIEGATYDVIRVDRDPAGATYALQARG